MARLLISGAELVVRLAWWEKALGRHGTVRVPLAAVRRVAVEADWWRALRGSRRRGLWIPETLCLGVREYPGGRDFVAIRPRRPVVSVELRAAAAPFSLLAVTVAHPQATTEHLRHQLPDIDPAGWRQAIPVPPEAE